MKVSNKYSYGRKINKHSNSKDDLYFWIIFLGGVANWFFSFCFYC